jgi:hypothetical protein
VVRGKKNSQMSKEIRRRLPIKFAINLLVVHQFIGLILFNGPINDMGVVGAVYFSITSMATIGIGDLTPNPKNMFETIITLVYLSTGITILSALYISISYHFQHFHYVTLLHTLRTAYNRLRRSKKVHGDGTPNGPRIYDNGFIENDKY